MKTEKHFLQQAGVYGFDDLEPIILASLVSEDPLLLIGKAGTGKTYLLNSLSEALGLNHKHYNASYLSFDDLVGFPYPAADGKSVSFIPTPATVWDAESILIDELSRCKPEIQNKFFSIVQEKRIQGIYLNKLRYRWAAMNPISNTMEEEEDYYEGSISLDQALADRFAFIVEVPDWNEMTEAEQEKIVHPAGEGANTALSVDLSLFIAGLKKQFDVLINHPSNEIIAYCKAVTTLMTDAGYRLSPRRARLLARNFTALFLVMDELGALNTDKERSRIFKLGFTWSIPHRAYKKIGDARHVIDAVHQAAFSLAFASGKQDRWLHEFNLKKKLPEKIGMLFTKNISVEYKSIAVIQFLHNASVKDKAIFAFTILPLFKEMAVVNSEALNDLSAIAVKLLHVEGTLEWNDYNNANNTNHPKWSECAKYIAALPERALQRKKRAKQLFLYLILNEQDVSGPRLIETQLEDCFTKIQSHAREIFA